MDLFVMYQHSRKCAPSNFNGAESQFVALLNSGFYSVILLHFYTICSVFLSM